MKSSAGHALGSEHCLLFDFVKDFQALFARSKDFSQGRPPVPGPFRYIGRMRPQEHFHIGACALVPVGRLLVRQFPVQDPELEGSIRAARQGVPAIGA